MNQANARGGLAADAAADKPKRKARSIKPKAAKGDNKGRAQYLQKLLADGETDASIVGKLMEKYPDTAEWYAHNLLKSGKVRFKKAQARAEREAKAKEKKELAAAA